MRANPAGVITDLVQNMVLSNFLASAGVCIFGVGYCNWFSKFCLGFVFTQCVCVLEISAKWRARAHADSALASLFYFLLWKCVGVG